MIPCLWILITTLLSLLQWIVDCSTLKTLPNITFVLAGNNFELTPNEYTIQVS